MTIPEMIVVLRPLAKVHEEMLAADLVVLDLEDAVRPDDKDAARRVAFEAVATT